MSVNSSENSSVNSSMSFIDHLKELRSSLVYISIGILTCTLLSLNWSPDIFAILTQPIRDNFGNLQLIGTGPAEAFIIKLKTAFIAGVLISSPNSFFQLWRFIAPAMYENEKKLAIPFVIISSFLFISGTFFCFFIVFPFAFQYFSNEYLEMGIQPNIKVNEYTSFIVRLVLVFGLVFELPVVCYFMAKMGLVNHKWLIQNGRYGVLIIFIVAAVLTPPDVISQFLLAIPLCFIYVLCILIAYLSHPKKK